MSHNHFDAQSRKFSKSPRIPSEHESLSTIVNVAATPPRNNATASTSRNTSSPEAKVSRSLFRGKSSASPSHEKGQRTRTYYSYEISKVQESRTARAFRQSVEMVNRCFYFTHLLDTVQISI